MKTGKYIPLGVYNNIKIGYGTVDFKNLKTIYLKLNSWLQPDNYSDDFDNIILKTRREIKKCIREMGNDYFKKESIVDLDIRTKGIKEDKRSFMNLEVTLYVENYFDVKSKVVKKEIQSIILNIIDQCLTDNNLFNFHNTKK
jgi:hypothetical protein